MRHWVRLQPFCPPEADGEQPPPAPALSPRLSEPLAPIDWLVAESPFEPATGRVPVEPGTALVPVCAFPLEVAEVPLAAEWVPIPASPLIPVTLSLAGLPGLPLMPAGEFAPTPCAFMPVETVVPAEGLAVAELIAPVARLAPAGADAPPAAPPAAPAAPPPAPPAPPPPPPPPPAA